jgi:hypothetical protein
MDDTPTTLLVAERDENTRAFLLDNLAADGYEPLGAQTEEETRLELRNHGPRCSCWVASRVLPDASAGAGDPLGRGGADATLPVICSAKRRGARAAARLRGGQRRIRPGRLCLHRAARPAARAAPPASAAPRRAAPDRGAPDRPARAQRPLRRPPARAVAARVLAAPLPGRRPTRVATKQELLRKIWGYRSTAHTRTLDAHACRLRKRLRAAGGDALVVNVRGVGYRLLDSVPTLRESERADDAANGPRPAAEPPDTRRAA